MSPPRLPALALGLCLTLPGLAARAQPPPQDAGTPTPPAAQPAAAGQVRVRAWPEPAYLETGRLGQSLDVDFLLENATGEAVELAELEVTAFGPDGALVYQHRVGGNGGSVETVAGRALAAGATAVLFNPLHTFPAELRLARLRFDFTWDAGKARGKHRASVEVRPQVYATRTRLQLPLAGRTLVHDAHDYYGHHRRLDWQGPVAKLLKLDGHGNFMRNAYDFVVTDAQGALYRGDGSRNEDWYAWDQPVLAPGDGTVVRARGDQPDGRKGHPPELTKELLLADPSLLWGNQVVIDHGNGEFSVLAHLRQGSVPVKPGQRVRRGQEVGRVGFSGDAFLVHLHYQLQQEAGYSEGLPTQWRDFKRVTGAGARRVAVGGIDSGDVVER